MLALLRTFSWQELLHHPWRNLAGVVAVMLGAAAAATATAAAAAVLLLVLVLVLVPVLVT